jgi:hypothetical protein
LIEICGFVWNEWLRAKVDLAEEHGHSKPHHDAGYEREGCEGSASSEIMLCPSPASGPVVDYFSISKNENSSRKKQKSVKNIRKHKRS